MIATQKSESSKRYARFAELAVSLEFSSPTASGRSPLLEFAVSQSLSFDEGPDFLITERSFYSFGILDVADWEKSEALGLLQAVLG